jgi:hypothetical protein
MSRKKLILLIALIAAPLIIYLLWPSDESRIRKLFREGTKAIQEKNLDDAMAKVSFNYLDDYGITYLILKDGIKRTFGRLDRIEIEYDLTAITVRDNTATADMDLRVIAESGSDAGYIVGDAAKAAKVRFALEKERGKWLVTKTTGLRVDY